MTCRARLHLKGPLLHLPRHAGRTRGSPRRQPADAASAGRTPLVCRRSAPPHLPLHQSRSQSQRSQRTVLLAGPLPSLLPSLPARGHPPALGPRHKRRPRPLARPALLHLSEPRTLLFFGSHAGRGRPRPCHVPRHGGRQHGRHVFGPAVAQLEKGRQQGRNSHPARPALPSIRPLYLEAGRRVLLAVGGHQARRPGRPARARQLPLQVQRSGALGVSPPLRRGRRVHARRRRRSLSLFLADWRPPHPPLLQPSKRRPVPARRLRH